MSHELASFTSDPSKYLMERESIAKRARPYENGLGHSQSPEGMAAESTGLEASVPACTNRIIWIKYFFFYLRNGDLASTTTRKFFYYVQYKEMFCKNLVAHY